MERLSWHDYFFKVAETIATRSTCLRRQVGAVIVNHENRIISTGYNGQVKDTEHCTSETCLRADEQSGQKLDLCRAIHAEQNALLFADRNRLEGAIIYCTHQPCFTCLKLLLNAGISYIFYKNPYSVPLEWYELCDEVGAVYWEYNPEKQALKDIVTQCLRRCYNGGLQILGGKRMSGS